MLRDFLTPDAFEIGIIRYLKRYSYQNTVNSHLWESLSNVSDVRVCVCESTGKMVEGYTRIFVVTFKVELKINQSLFKPSV